MNTSAEDYCLARSWRLRTRRADSRWLVRTAISRLPASPPHDFASHEREWQSQLSTSLAGAVRQRYGNPLVVWFLLKIVVPIVVRLVIEWWLKRNEVLRG